jgi:hypothetical protein
MPLADDMAIALRDLRLQEPTRPNNDEDRPTLSVEAAFERQT